MILRLRLRLLSLSLLSVLLSLGTITAADSEHDNVDAKVAELTLVKVGQPAPDFTCKTIDGSDFTLSAQKGKAVVLCFFDKIPVAGVKELSYLQQEVIQVLAQRKDVAIVGIGRGQQREELVKIAGENRLTFPLVADPQAAVYGQFFKGFVPRMVLVQKNGTIIWMKAGFHELQGVEALKVMLARELGAADF